jgi:uncharacterized protein
VRSTATELIRRHPLSSYVVLAYVFSIVLGVLLNVSLAFGLLALFGPAAAAFIVARVWRGRAGVAELWAVTTRWRVHALWYVAALALPVAGFATGHLLFVLAGNDLLTIPGAIQPVMILLFFLVIGEEIGWRGFFLRGLLRNRSPLVATAIVAVVWALWHSPLYLIPGMPNYGQPFLPFAAWVVTISFLLTWLWLGTHSASLATLMHGSANLGASLVFPLADAGALFTFSAIGFAFIGAPLVIASWSRWISVADERLDPGTAPVAPT